MLLTITTPRINTGNVMVTSVKKIQLFTSQNSEAICQEELICQQGKQKLNSLMISVSFNLIIKYD